MIVSGILGGTPLSKVLIRFAAPRVRRVLWLPGLIVALLCRLRRPHNSRFRVVHRNKDGKLANPLGGAALTKLHGR